MIWHSVAVNRYCGGGGGCSACESLDMPGTCGGAAMMARSLLFFSACR